MKANESDLAFVQSSVAGLTVIVCAKANESDLVTLQQQSNSQLSTMVSLASSIGGLAKESDPQFFQYHGIKGCFLIRGYRS